MALLQSIPINLLARGKSDPLAVLVEFKLAADTNAQFRSHFGRYSSFVVKCTTKKSEFIGFEHDFEVFSYAATGIQFTA